MLLELKIENFALARELEISFKPSFNVLTGASGSGKSLIIESLNFVLGARVKSARVITDKPSRVQALFDIKDLEGEIFTQLRESGFIEESDESFILMRKLSPNGRNSYYINGQLVPLSLYGNVGKTLVDIHGQRDNQYLLMGGNQRRLVDLASGEEASRIIKTLTALHAEYRETCEEIDQLKKMEMERNRRIDWIKHEIDEIEKASLTQGEDKELEKERKILSNAEKITIYSNEIYQLLSGENGVMEKIGQARKHLERWSLFDPEMDLLVQTLENCTGGLSDISYSVRDKGENLSFCQERMDGIISRQHQIDGLKRKYGAGIEEILDYLQVSRNRLEELEGSSERISVLSQRREELIGSWLENARKLTAIRKKTAEKIEREVVKELEDLKLPDSRFSILITTWEGKGRNETEKMSFNITPNGLDDIVFYISLNPGTKEQPLSLVASGGELSRIMLALKNIFARFRNFATLVLDEIDVGLGGTAAGSMGKKLKEISEHRQVICVTHLPIIASFADAHYQIEKITENGRTNTRITTVTGRQRVEEVARMIAGESVTDETESAAETMLKGSN